MLGDKLEFGSFTIVKGAYKKGRATFDSLFMNLPDPCFLISTASGEITLYNNAFMNIMQASAKELAGLTQFDISPDFQQSVGKSSAQYGSEIIANIELGDTAYFEWTHQRLNGELFTVEVSASLVKTQNEVMFLSCWRDVTKLKQQTLELEQLNRRLIESANRDYLTGLYNRRYMDEQFKLEITRAKRHKTKLSCLMLDIDHFKEVNDSFGHQVGDNVLIEIANLIRSRARESDVCARWGGEEFIVLLPQVGLAEALTIGESYRQLVASANLPEVGHLTVSIGVTEYKQDTTQSKFIKNADIALYNAKSAGRNLVCSYCGDV